MPNKLYWNKFQNPRYKNIKNDICARFGLYNYVKHSIKFVKKMNF